MIWMDKADLGSQAGMEHAMEAYFSSLAAGGDGTFNGMVGAMPERCSYEERTLTLRVDTQTWMENPNGVLHGGVSAAILDIAMGALCRYFSGGGMTPTVSMSVSYLRPAPVGVPVYVTARLPMRGHTLCHASGRIWAGDAPDETLCSATAVYHTGRQER